MRKLKKGFTLVELVVVIAIIAILSGISIGVYASITNEAKKSVDLQYAERMNLAIDVYEVDHQINSLTDVLFAIALNDGCEAKTQVTGTQFMWDTKSNDILYVDSDFNVLNLKGYSPEDHVFWMSLLIEEAPLSNNSSEYNDLFN